MTDKPSLPAVLDYYNVQYRPGVRQQKILCPVHGERRASCTLFLGDGEEWFKCFSCGAKGDVYELVKGVEGVDFKAAVRIIEDIPGAASGAVRKPDEPRGRSVPDGSGYQPRYRRAVPARTRRRAVVE